MHLILFLLFWAHFVAAIRDSDADLATYQPSIAPGLIGYTCKTKKQGVVKVKLQEIKAAHISACNLSQQKNRFTTYPTKFEPLKGQVQHLEFTSNKYYINPANALKYPDLYIIMTRQCMLAGMVTSAETEVNALPKLHYTKTIESRSINSISRRSRISLRKRVVKGINLLFCQKITDQPRFSQNDVFAKNPQPGRQNLASPAA